MLPIQFYKLFEILSRSKVTGVSCMLTALVIVAVLEAVSIVSVVPFLSFLGGADIISLPGLSNAETLIGLKLPTDRNEMLQVVGIFTFAFVFFTICVRLVAIYYLNIFVEGVRDKISLTLFKFYLSQNYSYFIDRNPSDLIKNSLAEVDNLLINVIKPTFELISFAFVAFFILVALVFINPLVAFASMVSMSGLYLLIFLAVKKSVVAAGENVVAANQKRFKFAHTALYGIKNIKVFDCGQFFISLFAIATQAYASETARYNFFHQFPKHLLEAITFGGVILMSLFLLNYTDEVNNLDVVLPVLGVYGFSAVRLQPALTSIFQGITALKYGSAAIENILSELKGGDDILSTTYNPLSSDLFKSSDLKVTGICFSYQRSVKPVLYDASLSIFPGEKLAIVGESGSGKSTLVDIILGLLPAQKGEIFFGGKRINGTNFLLFRSVVGYVSQDVVLSSEGLVENIAFGVPGDQVDHDFVIKCAKISMVEDLLASWPDDASVGDRGGGLSGGQRQRIGIARALYKRPKLLILDEATSALDRQTADKIIVMIWKTFPSLSVLAVTHDRFLANRCDRVMMIANGSIHEDAFQKEAH